MLWRKGLEGGRAGRTVSFRSRTRNGASYLRCNYLHVKLISSLTHIIPAFYSSSWTESFVAVTFVPDSGWR